MRKDLFSLKLKVLNLGVAAKQSLSQPRIACGTWTQCPFLNKMPYSL